MLSGKSADQAEEWDEMVLEIDICMRVSTYEVNQQEHMISRLSALYGIRREQDDHCRGTSEHRGMYAWARGGLICQALLQKIPG